MARYIDADLLIEELKELQKLHSPSLTKTTNEAIDLGLSLAIRRVRKSPTADVEEVKHGQWIGKPISGYARIRCSVCRTTFVQETGTWKRCPECGAKMDGGKE